MPDITIYHNPRCSKSRQTLQLLQERGIEPEIVYYLDNPPTPARLRDLIRKLGLERAHELVRKGEPEYAAAGLSPAATDAAVIRALASHPRLMERPVVVHGERAVLGRPPENVLELLAP